MSKTQLKPKWYAMYRGDTFIDLGTADYLAEKYHKKKQSLLYLSKPAYHRNAPKNSQRLTLYKMEDQAMKVIDKRAERNNDWNVGDVLVTNTGNIGLIVKNNYQKYCLMNINPGVEWAYSTREDDIFLDSCETVEKLYKKFSPTWHKVNAKLVIE